MAVVVSLKAIVDALDTPGDGWTAYLNQDTGEIVTVSDEDQRLVDRETDPDDLPEWQREILPKIREALESDRFLLLPDRFEIHEWSIMERFVSEVGNPRHREQLAEAIHGNGAFRMFRATTQQLGLDDAWYAFRGEALNTIAKDWLVAHSIAYE